MKRILIALFVLAITLQVSAKLKENQLLGKWKYEVVTDQGNMSGVFHFMEKDGKLAGEVITDDGYTIPFTKIEIKEENMLYLELQTDSDVIKISVKVDGKKFTGTGSSYQGDAPITGEKQE